MTYVSEEGTSSVRFVGRSLILVESQVLETHHTVGEAVPTFT